MPFSIGYPFNGKYIYYIDSTNSKTTILEEFNETTKEFETISKMRFRNTVTEIMFSGNFTITATDDGKVYLGMIVKDSLDVYTKLLSMLATDKLDVPKRIVMQTNHHVMISQCNNKQLCCKRTKFYYDRNQNISFDKKDGKVFTVVPDFPNLRIENDGNLETWV